MADNESFRHEHVGGWHRVYDKDGFLVHEEPPKWLSDAEAAAATAGMESFEVRSDS